MLFYPTERIAIFIDGPNLYGMSKGLGFDMDYKKVLEMFAKKGILIRAQYYTPLDEEGEFVALKPLVDYLAYNGYSVVTKPLKRYVDANGERHAKGGMNVEIAVDAMEISEYVDHIVIFSGDGALCRLVEALKRKGKRVSIISTMRADKPMVSDDLRRLADNFIELDELRSMCARPAKPAAA